VCAVRGLDGMCAGCRAWWSRLTPYPGWQVDWATSRQLRSSPSGSLGSTIGHCERSAVDRPTGRRLPDRGPVRCDDGRSRSPTAAGSACHGHRFMPGRSVNSSRGWAVRPKSGGRSRARRGRARPCRVAVGRVEPCPPGEAGIVRHAPVVVLLAWSRLSARGCTMPHGRAAAVGSTVGGRILRALLKSCLGDTGPGPGHWGRRSRWWCRA
jgi:hypothetical protein